jgi:oxygen-independent coproporphyrinogen-3 oxidase
VPQTVDAIEAEILCSPLAGVPAKTIFFGGGTPTFIPAPDQVRLLDAVRHIHAPMPDAEITTEANPGTVDAGKFAALRRAGFNRVSLGAQSFVDEDLVRLERVHAAAEIPRAVAAARQAGFENLNIDLMFGLPHQSRVAWNRNLTAALDLQTEHLSLYCLTIEPNTAFFKRHLRGQIELPDEETQVQMYEDCLDRMTAHGYRAYEISNFARPGCECQHNLAYWRHEDYAAYGPGAVACLTEPDGARVRTTNVKHPRAYVERVAEGTPGAAAEREILTPEAQRLEQLMLGLRLEEGLIPPPIAADALHEMRRRAWVTVEGTRIRLTRQGRHFASEVALALA